MLEETYAGKMYFKSQKRRTDVLCFSDLTASIIRQHHEHIEDDDRTKIIKSAVKLIQNDILVRFCELFKYVMITNVRIT